MLGAMSNGWLALATIALAMVSPSIPAGAASADAETPTPAPTPAELSTILAAARAPGARAVLVNVWATWCDPCREEMPDLIRFYRDHRGDGLRLILVSADDEDNRAEVARVLAQAELPADALSFIKRGDDMKFIDGLDRQWSGALPTSFLFDGRGRKRHTWAGPVTYRDLERNTSGLLVAPARPETKRARREP
jgi:thiol-disulfide isomerase/thioredoxin